jgi:hypothetical protein
MNKNGFDFCDIIFGFVIYVKMENKINCFLTIDDILA